MALCVRLFYPSKVWARFKIASQSLNQILYGPNSKTLALDMHLV